jgi:hypothetical protein
VSAWDCGLFLGSRARAGLLDVNGDTLLLADGWAVVVWENERGKMAVEATFEDMKRNLDIAVAWQDPAGDRWSPATAVVSNGYLDRSPRVAGLSRTNLVVTWVGNTNNHVTGNAVDGNQLWFSRWDGADWSVARVAVEVPYPLLKYDVVFDGADGVVVLSLDTDGDGQTVADHELFRVRYAGGAWGGPERLTTDGVPDDNPRLAGQPGCAGAGLDAGRGAEQRHGVRSWRGATRARGRVLVQPGGFPAGLGRSGAAGAIVDRAVALAGSAGVAWGERFRVRGAERHGSAVSDRGDDEPGGLGAGDGSEPPGWGRGVDGCGIAIVAAPILPGGGALAGFDDREAGNARRCSAGGRQARRGRCESGAGTDGLSPSRCDVSDAPMWMGAGPAAVLPEPGFSIHLSSGAKSG